MRGQLFLQPLTSMDCNITTSAHGRTGNLWTHALHVPGLSLGDAWGVPTLTTGRTFPSTGLVTSRVRLLTMLGDGNRKMTQNRRSYRRRKSGKKNRRSYGGKSGEQNRRSEGGKKNRISEAGDKNCLRQRREVHRRRKAGLTTLTVRTAGTGDGGILTGRHT